MEISRLIFKPRYLTLPVHAARKQKKKRKEEEEEESKKARKRDSAQILPTFVLSSTYSSKDVEYGKYSTPIEVLELEGRD